MASIPRNNEDIYFKFDSRNRRRQSHKDQQGSRLCLILCRPWLLQQAAGGCSQIPSAQLFRQVVRVTEQQNSSCTTTATHQLCRVNVTASNLARWLHIGGCSRQESNTHWMCSCLVQTKMARLFPRALAILQWLNVLADRSNSMLQYCSNSKITACIFVSQNRRTWQVDS